jgi:hypothetical protein
MGLNSKKKKKKNNNYHFFNSQKFKKSFHLFLYKKKNKAKSLFTQLLLLKLSFTSFSKQCYILIVIIITL